MANYDTQNFIHENDIFKIILPFNLAPRHASNFATIKCKSEAKISFRHSLLMLTIATKPEPVCMSASVHERWNDFIAKFLLRERNKFFRN